MSNDEDGHALWRYVTRHIKPLRKDIGNDRHDRHDANPPVRPDPPAADANRTTPRPPVHHATKTADSAPTAQPGPLPGPLPAPLPGLDRRTEEKLRRGQIPLDGRLDLHGMTRTEAYTALQRYVSESYSNGKRCLLVITGKGRSGQPGILKQRVPEWLTEPGMRPYILRFCTARPHHGGSGALYILLRRKRQ